MWSRTLAVASIALIVVVAAAVVSAHSAVFPATLSAEQIKKLHFEHGKDKHPSDIGGWPATIPKLNVTAYLGRWFNVYANLLVLATFQNNSYCATATYGPVDASNGRVGVYNWERQFSASGPTRNITGYAVQTDPSAFPGRLDVSLQISKGAIPIPAPYWIYDISPIVNGRYQWAVVSDWARLTLFVLVRDLHAWQNKYEKDVLALLKTRGFTGLDAPIKIVQGAECNYPPAA